MAFYMSLGGTCAVAYHLRKFQPDKYHSSPFDWCKMRIDQLNAVLQADFYDYSRLSVKKWSRNHPYISDSIHDRTDSNNDHNEDNDNNEGSLILTNSYGITFAHQIIKENQIDDFSDKLDRRISIFRGLRSCRVTLVRFESGKLSRTYRNDLLTCIKLLNSLFAEPKIILIVHKEYKDLSDIGYQTNTNTLVHYYDEFQEDWMFPGVDWSLFFDHLDYIIK